MSPRQISAMWLRLADYHVDAADLCRRIALAIEFGNAHRRLRDSLRVIERKGSEVRDRALRASEVKP